MPSDTSIINYTKSIRVLSKVLIVVVEIVVLYFCWLASIVINNTSHNSLSSFGVSTVAISTKSSPLH